MLSRWALTGLFLCAMPVAAAGQQGLADAPAPARTESPGFLESVGRFFDQSASSFRSTLKGAQDKVNDLGSSATGAAKDAATAARDATDALVKLPSTRFIEGRERCLTAPNGSPDCRAAAETICRGRGFAEGKSADTQSSRKCSVKGWLARRATGEGGDCQTETYVVRAACQ